MPRPFHVTGPELVERVRRIFALRGLSIGQVSRASRSLSPENHLHRIPHNLYSSIRNRSFSPNLYQVYSLSVLTGYRFSDWLAVFGFSLHDASRFQAASATLRTVELHPEPWHAAAVVPWFRENREPDFAAPLMPLTQWLALTSPIFHPVRGQSDSVHRYFRIGTQDAFAFPDLVPGSIVRISALRSPSVASKLGTKGSRRLFLVEQSNGLICARLCHLSNDKFVLCSRQLPYATVELEEQKDAVVLGMADFEIRPLEHFELPVVPSRLGRFWTPRPIPQLSQGVHVGKFIRKARQRAGISFREASQRTAIIARELGNRRYYCAASSLSDYETQKLPPRHIHKLISICAVYFASVAGLFKAAGTDMDKSGTMFMPLEILDSPAVGRSKVEPSKFFSEMQRRFGKLPYFLHDSVSALFGLRETSVRDIFWAGGTRCRIHPSLANALFLVVDRKRKIPRPALSRPKWAQPIYVLQLRGGDYLCGFCTLQSGTLALRSCSAGMPKLLRLRNQVDAEVVGRVVGVVRRLR
jgi:transcriptional regulator with XRE-family HTH domain